MYSSEDLERFYVEYQSEWVPRGLTMLAVLSQDELGVRAHAGNRPGGL